MRGSQPCHGFKSVESEVGRVDEVFSRMDLPLFADNVPRPVQAFKDLPHFFNSFGRVLADQSGNFRRQIGEERDLVPMGRDAEGNGIAGIDEWIKLSRAIKVRESARRALPPYYKGLGTL